MTKETEKPMDQQTLDISKIVSDALSRILALKTKRTYQEEVAFITATIKEYVDTTYITKESHEEIVGYQLFGCINHLKSKNRKHKFTEAIKVLEKLAEVK